MLQPVNVARCSSAPSNYPKHIWKRGHGSRYQTLKESLLRLVRGTSSSMSTEGILESSLAWGGLYTWVNSIPNAKRCCESRLTVVKHWTWLLREIKGKQEVKSRDRWVGQSVLQRTASREHKGTDTSRKKHLEGIRSIKAVPIERRLTLREHNTAIYLRDLLEELVGASKILKLEPRIWWHHSSSRIARAKEYWSP